MFDKIFKNSKYMGIATVITLVLVVALIWDDKKNPRKDFYGLLKSQTPAPAAN